MEANEENMKWALENIARLEGMDRFPRTGPGLAGWAKSFLSIVHDEKNGEWLLNQISDCCEHFPSIFEIRCLYDTHRTPADGITAEDVHNRRERAGFE